MADAFGAGMALGFQALSAKRQREQSERQQEQFDLLMGERDKDIKAQNAAKVFMGEASNVNDPEALMTLYHKHLPNFLDSPTAFTQASTFVKGHPAILQQRDVGKLDQKIATGNYEAARTLANQMKLEDYRHRLSREDRALGASAAGGSMGKGAKTREDGLSLGGTLTKVGNEEGVQTLIDQFGRIVGTKNAEGYYKKNVFHPGIKKEYGLGYNETSQLLYKNFPNMPPDIMHSAIEKLYEDDPEQFRASMGDLNLQTILRTIKEEAAGKDVPENALTRSGLPQPFERQLAAGPQQPDLYADLSGMTGRGGLSRVAPIPQPKSPGRFTTTPGATTLRTILNEQAPMAPEAQALTGFGGEQAPTTPALSRLAPVSTPGLGALPGQYEKPLARYRNVPVKEAVTMAYDAIKKQGMTDLADFPKLNQAFEEVLQGTEDAAIDQLQNAIPRVLARLWADTKALGEIDEEANERAQRQLLTLMKTPGNALNALYRSIFNAFDTMGRGVVGGVKALGEIPTPIQVERR